MCLDIREISPNPDSDKHTNNLTDLFCLSNVYACHNTGIFVFVHFIEILQSTSVVHPIKYLSIQFIIPTIPILRVKTEKLAKPKVCHAYCIAGKTVQYDY